MINIKKYFLERKENVACIGKINTCLMSKYNKDSRHFLKSLINGSLKRMSKKTAYIASGVSTIIFSSKDKDKVIGMTNDIYKILYLKKSKTEDFKLIKTINIKIEKEDHLVFIYEMNKLQDLGEWDFEYAQELGGAFDYAEEYVEDVFEEFSLEDSFNRDVINKLSRHVFQKYLTFDQDFHVGQFMKNGLEETICIDPIISQNINY